MKQFQRFIFDSYDLNPHTRVIALRYSLDDQVKFEETFKLPADLPLEPGHPDLDRALFALHLSGGASYYKTFCPQVIEVRSGRLNQAQAEFWNQLYTHGLGEFFYRNQLDFRGLINFPVDAGAPAAIAPPAEQPLPKRALVPFGGGKDSIVTTEILRRAEVDQTLLRVRSHRLITALAHTAKLPLLEVERTLAPELFKLGDNGAYQGHVPITAHLSFLSIVVSLLAGFDSVFFSNERSSSYGNVDYLGMEVNHQWSKSAEAEQMIRNYVRGYVTNGVQYLNVIRPLSELRIAQLFARYPEYLGQATSCNRNWTIAERSPDAPRWCGQCPKCAFSFALLSAYLPESQVTAAFGHNLFQDESLLPLYRQLWGTEGFKPFECVGTPEEAQAAFYLSRQRASYRDTPVMQAFKQEVLPNIKHPEHLLQELLEPKLQLSPPAIEQLLAKGGVL